MEVLVLLMIAYLPALGFQIGALGAEVYDPPPTVIGATLHGAAGIALAVVVLELAPRSISVAPPLYALGAFAAGAGFSVGLSWLSRQVRKSSGAKEGALAVYTVAMADLIGDGLMTGAGTAASRELGILLAASQVVANIPTGFAAAAHLRDHGGRRAVRAGIGVAAVAPALVSALIGWVFLRDQPQLAQQVVLCGVAGLLLAATVEDLIPQADRSKATRAISTSALVAGFILVAAISRLGVA